MGRTGGPLSFAWAEQLHLNHQNLAEGCFFGPVFGISTAWLVVWKPLCLDPSDGVFGRFDLAALCGCHTLNVRCCCCCCCLTLSDKMTKSVCNLGQSGMPCGVAA